MNECKHGDWHPKQVHCADCHLEIVEAQGLVPSFDQEKWGTAPYAAVPAGLTVEKLASPPCTGCAHPDDLVFEHSDGVSKCHACGQIVDIRCPIADDREAAGREQQRARFTHTFVDNPESFTVDDSGNLERRIREAQMQPGILDFSAVDDCGAFPDPDVACMPPPTGNPTARRTAWNALTPPHQAELEQRVADLLCDYRNKPGGSLEQAVESVKSVVLDG